MPSLTVSEFSYAALLYSDDSKEKGEFAEGTVAADETLSFSFTRPEGTGKLTIEIFAFKTYTDSSSEDDAILWGSVSGLGPIAADGILDVGKVALSVREGCKEPGTVSLNVRVPDGCELDIDDKTNFALTGTSPNFTVTHKGEGIAAGAHPLTLTVKKGGSPLYVLSEHINVFPGLETNTWSGEDPGEPRVIDADSFSTTVYVRGTGGWYEGSPYASTATASENNFGSFLSPLATIQKAVDKVLAMNDGTSAYTIYVDGALECDSDTYTGANGMADFSALGKNLTLTIKALSGTATLDAGARFTVDESGNVSVSNAGIGKRVMYANPASGTLNLTLENLTITGGNTADSGGGIYVNNGTLILQSGTISGNRASNSIGGGGGLYVGNGSTFTMEGGKISGNTATHYGGGVYVTGSGSKFNMTSGTISGNAANGTTETSFIAGGGGVYVSSSAEFEMSGGEISRNEVNGANSIGGGVQVSGKFTMTGGTISNNSASSSYYGGGGVYVNGGEFTMNSGTITDNTTTYKGGGVYVTGSGSKFTMTGGTIRGNEATGTSTTSGGGGVYVDSGTFTMNGSATISGNTAAKYGGGVYAKDKATFTMSGGAINANEATHGGVYLTGGATFTMGGGEISGNVATSSSSNGGGGVVVGSGSTFKMTGGTISLNTTQVFGGGLYVGGTFNMSGNAKITENTGVCRGGGIYVSGGKVTIEGGTISANKTTDSGSAYGKGGGIYVSSGTVTMTGGTISGNTAKNDGGGVYVDSGNAFDMTGGTISGNTAKTGKGVYVYASTTSKFNMSDGAKVDADNDVYLASSTSSSSTTYATITVAGALTAASPVATITPASYAEGTQVLSASGVSLMQTTCNKFAVTPQSNGTEWEIEFNGTQGVLKQVENAFYVRGSNAPWYASNNPSAQASDSNVGSRSLPFATIQKAVDKVIAENDGTIEYTIFIDGTFTATSTAALANFNSSAKTLTVKIAGMDSSNKAVIDGNNTAVGIAVGSDSVQKDVNLSLENLVIQNTKSSGRGGGVILCAYAENSHTIKNCEIKNNNATHGSAIYNKYGLLDLQNCVVSGNTTGTSGTIYVGQESALLTMSNVTIKNNSANNGGGIGIFYNATVRISDSSVIIQGNSGNTTAPARGAGISVWMGYLELSGSAKIEDDVGLARYDTSVSVHEVRITGALTGTSPVATFVLNSSEYSSGSAVLYNGGEKITQAICDKFAISDSSYKIVPNGDDGSQGVLASQ